VELLWWEAGDWDCRGRKAVVRLLKQRASQGAYGAAMELTQVSEQVLVVSRVEVVRNGPEAGFRPATIVTFRDEKVVSSAWTAGRASC
jgi:hypothetical protein